MPHVAPLGEKGHAARVSSRRPATPRSRRFRRVARGLAFALQAGVWTLRATRDRMARALGERPKWLAALATRMLWRFPTRPGAPDDLLDALLRDVGLYTGWRRDRPSIRVWYTPTVSMVPRWGVPVWPTVGNVADALRMTPGTLAWMADRRGLERVAPPGPLCHYHRRWLPKKSGGHRLIESPKRRTREAQRQILAEVLDPIPPHPAATGFRKGASILDHARVHVGAACVLRMDMEDFFLTTRGARVIRVFRAAGYPPQVARTLAGVCTTVTSNAIRHAPVVRDFDLLTARARTAARLADFHLPQGAPTSPALANLCARRLDLRLTGLCAKAGVKYSRYADDLAFSGAISPAAATRLARWIAVIVRAEGYTVNHRKTRVMPASQRQELVGVVVNAAPGVRRKERDRLKAILHNCVKHGPASQDRGEHPDFRAWLTGRVGWVCQVNAAQGARLTRLLEAIDWGGGVNPA